MGDILRSVGVIGVIILAVWGFGKIFTTDPGDPVKPVDYAQVVQQARPAASFELLAPSSLLAGWRANVAQFEPDAWRLGVLTDQDEYIGLNQLKVSVDRALARYAEGSKAAGTAQVAGETWTVRSGPKGRWTYVRTEGGLTTLLNGTASRPVIERYISSLSAG